MSNIKEKVQEAESLLSSLSEKVGNYKGRKEILESQIQTSKNSFIEIEANQLKAKKEVELLSHIEKLSKEKIKKNFENLVTYALRYIFGRDYKFVLDFGKRGNLSELKFQINTPDFDGDFDPFDTSSGGVLDIVSVALRIALMENSIPKVNGFIILDESFKDLHPIPEERYINASKFLKVINEKTKRQIILVTGRPGLKENADKVIEM